MLRPTLPLLLRDLVEAIDREGVGKLAAQVDTELGQSVTAEDAKKLAAFARALGVVIGARAHMAGV